MSELVCDYCGMKFKGAYIKILSGTNKHICHWCVDKKKLLEAEIAELTKEAK